MKKNDYICNINISPIYSIKSGGSFAGSTRRASRSPSPASGRERSRSVDQNGHTTHFSSNGPLVNISSDRTPSDDSLNSSSNRSSFSSSLGNNITLASPGSSSSPRSPISPAWNHVGSEGMSEPHASEGLSSKYVQE